LIIKVQRHHLRKTLFLFSHTLSADDTWNMDGDFSVTNGSKPGSQLQSQDSKPLSKGRERFRKWKARIKERKRIQRLEGQREHALARAREDTKMEDINTVEAASDHTFTSDHIMNGDYTAPSSPPAPRRHGPVYSLLPERTERASMEEDHSDNSSIHSSRVATLVDSDRGDTADSPAHVSDPMTSIYVYIIGKLEDLIRIMSEREKLLMFMVTSLARQSPQFGEGNSEADSSEDASTSDCQTGDDEGEEESEQETHGDSRNLDTDLAMDGQVQHQLETEMAEAKVRENLKKMHLNEANEIDGA
jgi:hypothetical protein